ncbi:MAG TPA: cation:proton antiporter [Pseudonocardiaceae bacterium]|jgi:Kef-type K+ transport system membrane component KefB|nr:cation:proton antiporter [Pseudonocardiaceae bacterium]
MRSLAAAADARTAIMLGGIAIVLVTGVLLGRVAKRFRQPLVIGEIAAGVVLGPSVLGLLPGDLPHLLFPADVRPLLSAVSQVGLVLFMFVVGWEFEKRLIRPHAALAAGVSLSSMVVAFGLGAGVAALVYPNYQVVAGHRIPFTAFVTFMGAAMSVTAFPVLARILTDNKLMGTRVGGLALASAAIDDVLAWFLLAYVSALVSSGGDVADLARIGTAGAGYIAVMFLVVRPLLTRLVRRWAAAGRWSALLVVLCAGAFLSAFGTAWIGLHAIFGAFLFGFIMPREPARQLAQQLRKPLDDVSLLLLPVFFIVTGLGVNLAGLDARDYLTLGLITAVACAGKLIGSMVPARLFGFSWRESTDLGLLMNARGLTELVILDVAVSLGVLNGRMFTMMVVMALVTTALAGPLLSRRPSGLLPDSARSVSVKGPIVNSANRPPAGPELIDATVLRRVCAHFATGVTVITSGSTSGAAGSAAGTTVNSFTSVSLDPPLVLFCLHRQSRLCPVVRDSGGFVVNFLTRRQKSLASAFAGRESADIAGVAHHWSDGGLPILSGALAFLACRLVAEHDGGDHIIFLGEVVELDTPSRHEDPLIFYGGSMRALDYELTDVYPH